MKVYMMFILVAVALVVFSIIFALQKKKKPFRRAFLTMLCGIITLILIDVTGVYTGVYLPLSAFSLCVSAIGGIPGIATMLIISNFL